MKRSRPLHLTAKIFMGSLLAASVSCKVLPTNPPLSSASNRIASIQSTAAQAKWELREAKTSKGPAKEAHIDSGLNMLTNIQQYASYAANDVKEAAERATKVWDMLNGWPAKYIGWKNWEHFRWFLLTLATVWTGYGLLAVVTHAAGWSTVSNFLLNFGLGMNPWRKLAARYDNSKDAAKIEVTVKNAENPAAAPEVTITQTTIPTPVTQAVKSGSKHKGKKK